MLDSIIVALFLFAPGITLFYLPILRTRLHFSSLERVLVGSITWLSFFVFVSYITSILSNVIFFFEFFMMVSAIVLVAGIVTAWKNHKSIFKLKLARENLLMITVLIILPLLVLSLIVAQTIYLEYDAIFYYFPLAKSIVLTGGLHTDFFQQSVIMSTTEPAIPLMYAFAGFVSGNPQQYAPASAMIPFVFILLTAIAIYMASKEIFDSLVGIASAGVFLALPITYAMASHYAYYLDIAFTFFIAAVLYATIMVYKYGQSTRVWWLVFGMTVSLSIMERDIMFFLIPGILAILLVPIIRGITPKVRWIGFVIFSLLFTGAYNFFFILDLRGSSLSVMATLIREIPVVFTIFVFLALCAFPQRGMKFPRIKTLLPAMLPLVIPVVFILRNISSAGAITSNYPVFNRDWQAALSLMALAGRPSTSSSNLAQLFHWSTLLSSPLSGGVFLVPLVLGMLYIIYQTVRRSEGHDRTPYFILLSFFLALLLMWSWVFGSSFQGSELRRLYYFSPLLSIFVGAGAVAFAKYLGLGQVRHRVALYLLLTSAYFWFSNFGSTWNIVNVAYAFDAIQAVQITAFIVFSAFFILSFYPTPLFPNMSNLQQIRKAMPYIATILAVCLIMTSGYFLAYNSSMLLKSQSQTSSEVPTAWENNLASIITYLNSNINNNGTIIASYALPIAYFTPHPVVDLTTLPGVMDLSRLSQDPGNSAMELLDNGVRYLLLPTTTNNYYNYTQNLATTVGALGTSMTQSPNIVFIKAFHDYDLYQIVPTTNLSSFYTYLYSGGNQWSALDSSTKLLDLNNGVTITGMDSNNLTLDGSNQTAFWTAATASKTDQMTISNDNNTIAGNASLKISLNGTGNMVIEHIYKTPQNWGNYSFVSFYLYGENTSKSITITFHTNGWVDYYAAAIKDNFTGWKEIQIPMDAFIKYGSPTWSSISFIEFLMGDRTTTYWLGDLSLQGYWLGVSGTIPPIAEQGTSTQIAISVSENATSFPPYLVVNSTSGIFQQQLSNGLNYVSVPSSYLAQGAQIELFTPSLRDNAGMTLYYLGVLS